MRAHMVWSLLEQTCHVSCKDSLSCGAGTWLDLKTLLDQILCEIPAGQHITYVYNYLIPTSSFQGQKPLSQQVF